MRMTGTVKVNFRNRELKEAGRAFCEDLALSVAISAQEIAQANVSPGQGPGPHPHVTPHDDTGALAQSIKVDVSTQGEHTVSEVYSDLAYGVYLEVGWHTKAGTFYRYPWLHPALLAAGGQVGHLAAQKRSVHFTNGAGKLIRVNRGHT